MRSGGAAGLLSGTGCFSGSTRWILRGFPISTSDPLTVARMARWERGGCRARGDSRLGSHILSGLALLAHLDAGLGPFELDRVHRPLARDVGRTLVLEGGQDR